MIKELGILASAMSLYTGGVRSPQYRSHEVVENDIAITYKYETNEVNSNDDLIQGNVYYFEMKFQDLFSLVDSGYISLNFYQLDFYDFSSLLDFDLDDSQSTLSAIDTFITINLNYNYNQPAYIDVCLLDDDYWHSYSFDAQSAILIKGNCIYYGENLDTNAYTCFSSASYIPIESVRRVYPDNIFGYVSEFIDEHLLNGIPNIDDVSYTIGGKSITMRSWLNTSICVVLAILLIALLVWFIRYLFRLFSGLLH